MLYFWKTIQNFVCTNNDLIHICNNIGVSRRSLIPILLQALPCVHDALDGIKIENNKKEKFLLVSDREENIFMISTIVSSTFLYNLATIFVDRIFHSCPRHKIVYYALICFRVLNMLHHKTLPNLVYFFLCYCICLPSFRM